MPRRIKRTRPRAKPRLGQARELNRLAREGRLDPPDIDLQLVELAEVVGWDPLREPEGPRTVSWDELTA